MKANLLVNSTSRHRFVSTRLTFRPDGHHKNVVEHTLNILFLPGIHRDRYTLDTPNYDNDSQSNLSISTRSSTPMLSAHPQADLAEPGLVIPGTNLSLPSPFHIKLHVITRLSFNEQGLITHHRDFWDVKDLMGLVPGAALAQWIGARLAAHGISLATRLFLGGSTKSAAVAAPISRSESVGYGIRPVSNDYEEMQDDFESARGLGHDRPQLSQSAAYGAYVKNAIALHGMTSFRSSSHR